ncbi:hypothetical protein B0O99DRAFT_609997 [Bisporella sp. PMI_857]|nr:hypothetical protein B0O99DRAFT_609997 [Bisporella sp. PMI_857]
MYSPRLMNHPEPTALSLGDYHIITPSCVVHSLFLLYHDAPAPSRSRNRLRLLRASGFERNLIRPSLPLVTFLCACFLAQSGKEPSMKAPSCFIVCSRTYKFSKNYVDAHANLGAQGFLFDQGFGVQTIAVVIYPSPLPSLAHSRIFFLLVCHGCCLAVRKTSISIPVSCLLLDINQLLQRKNASASKLHLWFIHHLHYLL